MSNAPDTGRSLTLESRPGIVRNERRWQGRDSDGQQVVLAQLLPELAADESLRRRYAYESERLAELELPQLAKTLAVGPQPDPRHPASEPPWRLRAEPEGQRLNELLDERAPLPVDEAIELLRLLADTLAPLHDAGIVLRDLEPRSLVRRSDGSFCITDIGMARVDILSSRTASSLMLESSSYAAPEHLRAVVVDARADVYSAAAIAWEALTGSGPYGDASPFRREANALPDLDELRPGLPGGLSQLLHNCLSLSPERRPKNARHLQDLLSGRLQAAPDGLVPLACQACGALMRPGLRLCLECGKEAVQFREASGKESYSLILKKAEESDKFNRALREVLAPVTEGPLPSLNFLIGDHRMYSKTERESRTHLPALLMQGLDEESAATLALRMQEKGLKVRRKKGSPDSHRVRAGKIQMVAGAVIGASMAGVGAVTGFWPLYLMAAAIAVFTMSIGAHRVRATRPQKEPALLELRKSPVALPASDPLVSKLAARLSDDSSSDVREEIAHLALLVQRLCDKRAEQQGHSEAMQLIAQPLDELVDLLCGEIDQLHALDRSLGELDEGRILRALAASEARGDGTVRRTELMQALDRLRDLEDSRAAHMGALLQAAALLERAVQLGLSEVDEELAERSRIAAALAALDDE